MPAASWVKLLFSKFIWSGAWLVLAALICGFLCYFSTVRSTFVRWSNVWRIRKVFRAQDVSTLDQIGRVQYNPDPLAYEPFYADEHVTSFYDLAVKKWRLDFLKDDGVSGPFAVVDDKTLLFVSRCGLISLVHIDGDKVSLVSQRQLSFAEKEIYCGSSEAPKLAGVKGLLFLPGLNELFLSYHNEVSPGCIGLRISRAIIDLRTLQISRRRIIFDSKPCRSASVTVYTAAGGVFEYDRTNERVFFSVGDFGDNENATNLKRTYASIWAHDLSSQRSYRWAIGSRNVQGLAINAKSVLFGSEHGPKGGDEINVIDYGDDLGWPFSSYGIDYGFQPDPKRRNSFLGNHDYGKKPDFVFFPSLGISGLRFYPNDSYFLEWGGDLILSSLKGSTIFRLKTDGPHVVYAEPLANVGERVRSIAVAPDGHLFFKADPDVLIRLALAADAQFDKMKIGRAAAQTCKSCHFARNAKVPVLEGMDREFILAQLKKFIRGERKNETMANVARGLSDLKQDAVALYFSKQKASHE